MAKVAKHGNRSISSKCGSADVLKELGVNIELTPEQAAHIVREVSSFALCVGVFVNEDVEKIKRIVDQTMIDIVQYSGDESPEVCQMLKGFVPVMKSFKV